MDTRIERSLETIDNIYSHYLEGKLSYSSLEKGLASALSSISINGKQKKIEVTVVKSNGKESFFGMRIFPVMTEMDTITNSLVNEKKSFKEICKMWREIQNWYLEIDDTVFDRSIISFTPKELTSLTLHEIGHTVYTDMPVEIFYRAFQESYIRMKISEKAPIKFLYMLYSIPLSATCMLRHWTSGKDGIKQEIFADMVSADLGYGEFLLSGINKIIKTFGNSIEINNDSAKVDKIAESVKWANLNIIDMTKRKNKLKDELYYRTAKSNSSFIKAISFNILSTLGLKMSEAYTGAVVESSIELISEDMSIVKYNSYFDIKIYNKYPRLISSAMESAYTNALESFKNNKRPTLPSEYELDAIYIEIDRIENHHDRIYVLDLIYNKINDINEFKELIENDTYKAKKFIPVADRMLKRLEDMRHQVLGKRSFSKDYKLFVKYPEGYEG